MELVERVQHEPREVSRVRHALADALDSWGVCANDCDVAVLLTSEVVTNAIRYGEPPVQLTAVLDKAQLRVVVSDARSGGADEPIRPRPDVQWHDGGGRGLHLVEALADRWGVVDRAGASDPDGPADGKEVWFELALAP
ncbi:MAG: ATP-binding protein [Angustibacter sp.]